MFLCFVLIVNWFVFYVYGVEAEKTPGSGVANQLKLAVDLCDGSRIVGLPSVDNIGLKTEFADINLPIKLIDRIEFIEGGKNQRVILKNGDKLMGSVQSKGLELQALWGKCFIEIGHISGITVFKEFRKEFKDLQLHLSFERDEGGRVIDSSKFKNHGIVEGGRWILDGKCGGAFEFDGIDDYVRIRTNEGLRFGSNSFTICAWVRWKTQKQQKYQTIVGTNWGAQYLVELRITQDDKIEFLVLTRWPDAGCVTFEQSSIESDRWHHVAGVRDAEKRRVMLYVDGKKMAEGEDHSGEVDTTVDWSVGTMIGSNNEPDHNVDRHFFHGAIDEVMIFRRALDATEVYELYELQK
jgi:hypothetical protein